jgi:hypothetical protein
MRSSRIIALAAISGALLSTSVLAHPPLTPAPKRSAHFVPNPAKPPFVAPPKSKSGTWAALTNAFPGAGFPDTSLLLTDGTVMMHDGCTSNWFKLTPTNTGDYHAGTWSKMGAMPSGYTPLYFGSQVMSDGQHVLVAGGEYLNCNPVWTNKAAIYDTVADTWTNVNPPSGWAKIGDAQSVVRTDGLYMQADCCTNHSAIGTISGSTVTWNDTAGTGKGDVNDEEGWTQLPDGTILTVDANRDLGSNNDVEIYSETTNSWTTQATKTPVSCTDSGSHEIGPGVLLPSGLVYQICGTAHTAVYAPLTGAWTVGPDIPAIDGALDVADGPAAVLPTGHVLMQASPGVFLGGPSHFFEATIKDASHVTLAQVSEPADAPNMNSYQGRMMLLPTGEVFWSSDDGDIEIYTPQGKPVKNAIPVISTVAKKITAGSSNNSISGVGFNGLTYGGYYGDDVQQSTNYPLVRITNKASGHVCYAKTHNYATGISDGSTTNAQFDVPASCEKGKGTLQVVVNGVASKAKKIALN